MAKRFRLRISRVISSLNSCRSKDDSAPSPSPVFCLSPVNPKAVDIDFPPPPPPASSPSRPSRRLIAPVVSSSASCRCRGARPASGFDESYLWRKEQRWHVVTCGGHNQPSPPRRKIDLDDDDDDDSSDADFLFPPPAAMPRRRRREKRSKSHSKSKSSRSRARASTSSADSGWFSSEDEENDEWEEEEEDETETLISSSRSFSTSPDNLGRRSGGGVLRRLVGCRTAATADGFAVVKRSEDPRGDFRRSMAEMVVGKGIYDAGGLERLLRCFLQLNSRRHHAAIVAAFEDVWAAIFPAASPVTSTM